MLQIRAAVGKGATVPDAIRQARERAVILSARHISAAAALGKPLAAWRGPAETQAAEPRPRDRFDCGNGPVRILMKEGMWLVPEGERPATSRS
jgi:hypothetical protein